MIGQGKLMEIRLLSAIYSGQVHHGNIPMADCIFLYEQFQCIYCWRMMEGITSWRVFYSHELEITTGS